MRKKSFLLLVLLFLFGRASPASAWAPEGLANTSGELPSAVQELLPADEEYVFSFYNHQTYFVLMNTQNETRIAYVFQPDGNDRYHVDLQSAPLPIIDGGAASIGSTGTDFIYLFYESCGTTHTFKRQHDGRWLLSYVQAKESFEIDPVFGIWLESVDGYSRYLVGDQLERNLASLDPHSLPCSIGEVEALIDTTNYAMVKSDVPTDRLHLRASPSKEAASYGRYYGGTPVYVHAIEGDWARIAVCGVEGYMLTKHLAIGQDMRSVNRYLPDRVLLDACASEGVPVYLRPEESVGLYVGTINSGTPRMRILADVGDDWYHIACDEIGLTGYVQSKFFWEGNG